MDIVTERFKIEKKSNKLSVLFIFISQCFSLDMVNLPPVEYFGKVAIGEESKSH